MKTKSYDQYEDEIEDVSEIVGQDFKLNPDYYIHSAILKAQSALNDPDVKQGFARFRLFIEHIEGLCRAAGMVDEEKYLQEIDKYKKSDDYTKTENQGARLANKKIEILMRNAFSNKVGSSPLKA